MEENIKESYVRNSVKKDTFACDFLMSIFVSAIFSYRHDTLLRPFPPAYKKSAGDDQSDKDFELLRKDISKVQKLEKILNSRLPLQENITELLYWLFSSKKFTLKSCDFSLFSELQEKTGHAFRAATPTHLFEVVYSSSAEEKFQQFQGTRDVMYAYHGSRLENFHSILHHGLRGSLNKNSLFGEGTYLSSELSVSLDYSPYGHGWMESILGKRLSCVAVCEVIDDPTVKCNLKDVDDSDGKRSKRSRIEGSIGGDVPEKYYVITNDDVVRVKYLFVYASRDKYLRNEPSWLQKHKFILVIFFYGLLLVTIGLYKSVSVHSTVSKFFYNY